MKHSRLVRWIALVLGVCGALFLASNAYVILANSGRLYDDVALIPARQVGIVLGTSRILPGGQPNRQFALRMTAAARLYHSGKVSQLLLSGGHNSTGYDEPLMMQRDLMAAGVPAEALILDNAGYRTLDSVVRARRVFGLTSCAIITQRYHNSRALEIARAHGLDAVGYCAGDPRFADLLKTGLRESVARVVALLDLYVWHRQPRQAG